MYGNDICVEFERKVSFEIPHEIFYPYIERCVSYLDVKISELSDLRAHKCFWNACFLPIARWVCGHLYSLPNALWVSEHLCSLSLEL